MPPDTERPQTQHVCSSRGSLELESVILGFRRSLESVYLGSSPEDHSS